MRYTLHNLDIRISIDKNGQPVILVFPLFTSPEVLSAPIAELYPPIEHITPQRLGAELSDFLHYTVAPKLAELHLTPPVEGEGSRDVRREEAATEVDPVVEGSQNRDDDLPF